MTNLGGKDMSKVISIIKLICHECGYIWDEEDEIVCECPRCNCTEASTLDMTRY